MMGILQRFLGLLIVGNGLYSEERGAEYKEKRIKGKQKGSSC